MSPFLVVIAGGTASGKSTAASRAAEQLGALLISHDRYYLDVEEPRGHNYDHPDALDTSRLVADLQGLLAGRPTGLPVYDFPTHRRQAHAEVVEPSEIILVEGILTLADRRVAELAALSVYVDAPDDIRLARRIRRDVVSRGRSVEGVLDQYLATVRPMHNQFVAPCAGVADLVLSGIAPIEQVVGQLVAAVRARV